MLTECSTPEKRGAVRASISSQPASLVAVARGNEDRVGDVEGAVAVGVPAVKRWPFARPSPPDPSGAPSREKQRERKGHGRLELPCSASGQPLLTASFFYLAHRFRSA